MIEWAVKFTNLMFAQSAAKGAATVPEMEGGDYVGPDRLGECMVIRQSILQFGGA
jgi:hypothetical protein